MPKVSEDYVKKKKDSIVAAALKVCKEKPLYEITMTDIIKETGLSQGGIYRYFSNLDEILIEVINKANSNINYKDDIDEILAKRYSAAEKINDMLNFLGKYIKENVKTMGKFQFELTVLLANHPD
ncbi:MAG: TetR/AcrR family transcriptional regulator [bacterium]